MRSKILIVGNGVSANAVAIGLSAAGHEVSLVGPSRSSLRAGIGEHLAPQALSALQSLGLVDLLSDPAHLRSPGITGSWLGSNIETDYALSLGGDGFNLDRDVFDAQLRLIASASGVKRLVGPIGRLDRVANHWRVQLPSEAGSVVDADLLVDATGRSAALARRLGAHRRFFDDLMALSGRLSSVSGEDTRLVLETNTDGWWYFVRQTDERQVAVFLTDGSIFRAPRSTREAFWYERLSRTATGKASVGSRDVSIEFWDARSMLLWPQAGHGWVAVGDAAMSFDPISAAGMTKALVDAVTLTRHFSEPDFLGRGVATLLEERRLRWRNYALGLERSYRSRVDPSEVWWAQRQRWARRLLTDANDDFMPLEAEGSELGGSPIAPIH